MTKSLFDDAETGPASAMRRASGLARTLKVEALLVSSGRRVWISLALSVLLIVGALAPVARAQDIAPEFIWNAEQAPPKGALIAQDKARGMTWLIDLRARQADVVELPYNAGNHETALTADGTWLATGHYETLPKGAAPLSGNPGDEVSLVDIANRKSKVYPTVASPKPATRSHGVLWLEDGRLAVTAELANAVVIYQPPNAPGAAQVIELGATGCRTPHILRQIPGVPLLFVTCRATNPGDGPTTPGFLVGIDLKTGATRALKAGTGSEGMTVTAGGEVWVGNYRENTVSVFGFENNERTLEGLAMKAQITVPQPMRLAYESTTGQVGIITSDPQAQAGSINFRVYDATSRKLNASTTLSSQSRGDILSHGLAAIPGYFIAGGVNNQAILIVSASDLKVEGEVLLPRCTGAAADQNNKCSTTMRNPNDTTPAMVDGFAWSNITLAPGN